MKVLCKILLLFTIIIFQTIGYSGNGTTTCDLINECELNIHNCASNADCTNNADTPGFTCACHTGFTGDGFQCTGKLFWGKQYGV